MSSGSRTAWLPPFFRGLRADPAAAEHLPELAGTPLGLHRRPFQQGVHLLGNFPLDETAAAGGGLEFNGDALVLGAPLLEPAHGIHAEFGLDRGIAEAGQGAFHPVEERVLGESAQLGQRLG